MKSIKAKFVLVMVCILIIFAVALLIANGFFLDDYYVYQTKHMFISASDEATITYRVDEPSFLDRIREIDTKTGYKLVLANEKGDVLFSSVPEYHENVQQKIDLYQREIIRENKNSLNNQAYHGVTFDDDKNSSFVVLISEIEKDRYLIVSQPLAQILTNAQIANAFLLLIGAAMLIVTSIAALIFGIKLVRPILEINRIANAIERLDFSNKYQGKSKDEIGMLGNSINSISEKLDTTIQELKANNEQLIKEMKLQKRFVASVSHEFNTPVGLIRGYTEALEKHMYTTELERSKIIQIIINEADRLNHLVNDLLLVLRFDSKSFKLNLEMTDITEIVNESISIISSKADEKGVNIVENITGRVILNIDRIRIAQVMDNLLSNALKHVNANGRIGICCEDVGGNIKISVSNTGSYISDEDKKNIFDAFYRIDDSRNRTLGGNGLGLSVVKGIVLAHGGTCGVSDIQNGVVFWVALPKNNS